MGFGCPYCTGRYACIENSLQTLHPELSKEWHATKNGNLTPDDIVAFSNKKVWWQCKKGHEWEAVVYSRARGSGCPFCAGQRVCSDNCLQNLYPELAKQWHPVKNGNLTPACVTLGTKKKVWWQCEKGHEWEASVANRKKGSGCPDCSRERQTSFPEQAIYFYLKKLFNDVLNRYKYENKWEIDVFVPTLNFGIEYDGIYYHNEKKTSDAKKEKHLTDAGVLLLKIKETKENKLKSYRKDNIIYCGKNFSETHLNEIIEGCIYYISEKITQQHYSIDVDVKRDRSKIYDLYVVGEKEKSLSAMYPELAKQWHFQKNGDLIPSNVKAHSGKKVWWQCKRGHEWEALISQRTYGRGCPYCSGLSVCNDNSLQTLDPELSKQWHPTKNGDLTPNDVTASSGKKVWWQCGKGHEWQAAIANRKKGHGCPYCSGKYVCSDNCLQTLDPKLAKQWHPTRNGGLTPIDVTLGTNKKVWWQCEKGHEWEEAISNRTRGFGCPYCSGRRVCHDNCLQKLNPTLSKQWHPTKNGDLTPSNVTMGSPKKVWWQCKRGHEWEAIIYDRVIGHGCPYCSGQRVCDDNSLQTLNPELAKQWHPIRNIGLTPSDVTTGSGKKVWWQCKEGHEWEARVFDRARNGNSCPYCSSKRTTKQCKRPTSHNKR